MGLNMHTRCFTRMHLVSVVINMIRLSHFDLEKFINLEKKNNIYQIQPTILIRLSHFDLFSKKCFFKNLQMKQQMTRPYWDFRILAQLSAHDPTIMSIYKSFIFKQIAPPAICYAPTCNLHSNIFLKIFQKSDYEFIIFYYEI